MTNIDEFVKVVEKNLSEKWLDTASILTNLEVVKDGEIGKKDTVHSSHEYLPADIPCKGVLWHFINSNVDDKQKVSLEDDGMDKFFGVHITEEEFKALIKTVIEIGRNPKNTTTGIIGNPIDARENNQNDEIVVYPIEHPSEDWIINCVGVNIDGSDSDKLDDMVELAGHPGDIPGTGVGITTREGEYFSIFNGSLSLCNPDSDNRTYKEKLSGIF